MKRVKFIIPLLMLSIFTISTVQAAINMTYTVDAFGNRTHISKYVYGTNGRSGSYYKIQRSGGNRLTAYNWENNWSNAGADWWWNNDQLMSSSPIPGKAITDFRDSCITNKQDSVITLQMAGYVSDSVGGMVDCNLYAAPSYYFKKVVFAKNAPFCSPPGSPVTTDANVYMDEFVNFLVSKYGYGDEPNGVKFYDLDNEPDLWYADDTSPPITHATHWEVHPYLTTCAEYKNKSIELATAVKNVDPYAQMLGPVSYGFAGYTQFQGAPDWGTEGAGYPWFLSYYLAKMKAASDDAEIRLLDALDVHWYPEAQDGAGHRILDDIRTEAMYNARMQAPRTLWDTGYIYPNMTYPVGEVSWINQSWFAQYLPLITRLKNDIQNYNPDTNLAITEYAYGPDGYSHWSTAIATADVLGIFGKYGVYIATYWGGNTFTDTATKMYTNYNGSNATFGDMNIPATMSDKTKTSIYASMFDGNDYEIHLIVINKDQVNAINGTFTVTSDKDFNDARVWAFDGNSTSITERTAIHNITGNTFTYTLPRVSVAHFVLKAPPCPRYELTGDCQVDMSDLVALIGGPGDYNLWLYQLVPDECGGDPLCPDINGDLIINFNDFALLAQGWGG